MTIRSKRFPPTASLLTGVARFLAEDVREATDDPAIRFRALIAANLLRTVLSELQQPARSENPPDGDLEAILATLRSELAIANPGFDLRDDIETL